MIDVPAKDNLPDHQSMQMTEYLAVPTTPVGSKGENIMDISPVSSDSVCEYELNSNLTTDQIYETTHISIDVEQIKNNQLSSNFNFIITSISSLYNLQDTAEVGVGKIAHAALLRFISENIDAEKYVNKFCFMLGAFRTIISDEVDSYFAIIKGSTEEEAQLSKIKGYAYKIKRHFDSSVLQLMILFITGDDRYDMPYKESLKKKMKNVQGFAEEYNKINSHIHISNRLTVEDHWFMKLILDEFVLNKSSKNNILGFSKHYDNLFENYEDQGKVYASLSLIKDKTKKRTEATNQSAVVNFQ
jgi:hypothetical protein